MATEASGGEAVDEHLEQDEQKQKSFLGLTKKQRKRELKSIGLEFC